MSAPRPIRRRVVRGGVRIAISVASALIMAGIFANVGAVGDAGALTARSGSVVVAATPTARVADGSAVSIRVLSATGIDIYQVRAHLCAAGASVRTNFDFGFQGRRCANVALGRGTLEQTVEFGSGVNSARLDTFRIGAGSVHWVNELGYDQVQTCGPGHPCDLVVRVQITNDTLFFTLPLCYGSSCPAEVADPVVLVPTPTSTSTTVHPTSTTSSTTIANAPVAVAGRGGSGTGTGSASHASSARPAAANHRAAVNPTGARPSPTGSAASPSAPPARPAAFTAPDPGGLSQNQRVLLAALAGAIGSAWIVSIFLRGRALLVPLITQKRLV